jgi:hypothetical protein
MLFYFINSIAVMIANILLMLVGPLATTHIWGIVSLNTHARGFQVIQTLCFFVVFRKVVFATLVDLRLGLDVES